MSFESNISFNNIILEEGTITNRKYVKVTGMTETLQAAKVNGPTGDKGQYIWVGTYSVYLDRGVQIDNVYALSGFGTTPQQCQRVIPKGERITVIWLNRKNTQIPVILDGCTLDYYEKMVNSNPHLLDFGEIVIKSAISDTPEETSSKVPFGDNQFDTPNASTDGSESVTKAIKKDGAEIFLDKFGRLITLSRHKNHEFMVTHGKIDSGQVYVADKTTIADQDTLYSGIENDESNVAIDAEPFSQGALNLQQYQQVINTYKDSKGNAVVKGILPRFDKWSFIPVLIRTYEANSDGVIVEKDAVYQERGQTLTDSYGYVRTITNTGDLKEFINNRNQRVMGDSLISVGKNYEFKLKTTDRLSNGDSNPNNLVHEERLADGSLHLRTNENVTAGTQKFDLLIESNGTTTLSLNSSGGTTSNYKTQIKIDASTGNITVDTVGSIAINAVEKIVIDSEKQIYVGGENGAEPIPLGDKLQTYLNTFRDIFSTWVPAPCDGGAVLKAAITAWLSTTEPVQRQYLSTDNKVAP